MDYVKLKDLVDRTFQVKEVKGYTFKKWDTTENRMLNSDRWMEGYSKKWQVETDKGQLDLGSGQMGTILESVHKGGKSDINGRIFQVKSNGKTGMEIRYFFNPVQGEPEPNIEDLDDSDDDIDLSEVPF